MDRFGTLVVIRSSREFRTWRGKASTNASSVSGFGSVFETRALCQLGQGVLCSEECGCARVFGREGQAASRLDSTTALNLWDSRTPTQLEQHLRRRLPRRWTITFCTT